MVQLRETLNRGKFNRHASLVMFTYAMMAIIRDRANVGPTPIKTTLRLATIRRS